MNQVFEWEGRKRPGQRAPGRWVHEEGLRCPGWKSMRRAAAGGGEDPAGEGTGPRAVAPQGPSPSVSSLTRNRETAPAPLGLLVLEEASVS